MDINEKWAEHLTLNWIESLQKSWSEDSSYRIVERAQLCFTFYDCDYLVNLNREDVETNSSSFTMAGPAKLFDSMQDLLENKYWDKLRQTFERFCNWSKEGKPDEA